MTPGARLQAAIEILEDWERGEATAERLVEAYGRAHRFAGSRDRAAIGERVFGVFRRRGDLMSYMDSDAPRALVLGSARLIDGLEDEAIAALCSGGYAPTPLESGEKRALGVPIPSPGPNLPAWIAARLERDLGTGFGIEIEAMRRRAEVDLRVNPLKAGADAARTRLAQSGIASEACRYAPFGLRLTERAKPTDLVRDGWVEIQDEGSQIASRLVEARPGARIADLCAGAGGKALALAADMENRGEIVAHDENRRRLDRLRPRAERAGASIILETRPQGSFDRVLIDAPCSGSGTWRRAPDAPWRLREEALEALKRTQSALLDTAAALVRPGGRLIYVTCSLLAEENRERVGAFLDSHADFAAFDWTPVAQRVLNADLPESAESGPYLALRPGLSGTDGFFIAILERKA